MLQVNGGIGTMLQVNGGTGTMLELNGGTGTMLEVIMQIIDCLYHFLMPCSI